ncbi:hypothetical protein [Pectobacterium peruviense]|uniref:hypothetical protein n=1 Tax=Pectobacterium peruviense TaxID=2066479 RepID=UPI0011AB4F57|nr:hypothetical protein [Pectobacterium peruviense]
MSRPFLFGVDQFFSRHSLRHSNRLARYSAAYPNTRPTRVRDDVLCRHYLPYLKYAMTRVIARRFIRVYFSTANKIKRL